MNILKYNDPNFKKNLKNISQNNKEINESILEKVKKIISLVKKNKDEALIEICNEFDGANFKKPSDLVVCEEDINNSINNIEPELLKALKLAYERIKSYHEKQLPKDFEYQDKIGVTLGNKWQAIDSVCVYTPGGTAIYPSSVLMSSIPAIVAGVKNISVTVPSRGGKIDNSILAACKICGIKNVYKIGGAAAVAAFTFGTDSIKNVDKIVGPGNSFVTLAKKELFGIVGIDMIAGPTDILIISDTKSNPSWVAADLLSQLEHGEDSRAILICDCEDYAKEVIKKISELSINLTRKEIIHKSLKNSYAIIVENIENDSASISNQIAPEHLEIMTDNPEKISKKITNAGAIFLGRYTPEAIGDYIAGPSHTLPTMSNAKFASGLSVFDFLKRISTISCTKESFLKLEESVSILAQSEGFDAHKLSSQIRKS
jgi:histidinol dehydrogenase